jgi:hypothetical protein
MRTHYTSSFPKWITCTQCSGHMPFSRGRAGVCEACMERSTVDPLDRPCCEAPGCTREVAMSERLCPVHVAIAAGEPPRLYDWQLEEVYRRLGDPAASKFDTYTLPVPGIGHVKLARRKCVIEGVGEWHEWIPVAA